MMCKLEFIAWPFDLKGYLIFGSFVMNKEYDLHFNKLDGEVDEWLKDIQIDRKCWGKRPIHS